MSGYGFSTNVWKEAVVRRLADDSQAVSSCCGNKVESSEHRKEPRPIMGEFRGSRVFRVGSSGRMVLDIPMVAGRLTPIALGCHLPQDMRRRNYEVTLLEMDAANRVVGGVSLWLPQ